MPTLAAAPEVVRAAEVFVATGRIVPGLTVCDDGRARSWWWPLPSAADRGLLVSLLDGNEPSDHARVAGALGDEVDRVVRERLRAAGVELLGRRAGRRTVPDAWLRSLTADDPWLPSSLDPVKVEAFAAAVDRWVRSGVVGLGRARLCVRIHEPPVDEEPWVAEALAQDIDESSLLVGVSDVWAGRSPFGPEVVEELLGALGRMARIAPELAGLLDGAVPDRTMLDSAAVVELFGAHAATLADSDIAILLPSWWTNRRRLGLRARTATARKAVGAVTASGLGFEQIVSFTWQAALGDQRLTKADLASLANAVEAKQSLVRVRGMWVEVRPEEIAAALAHAGTRGEATAGELVRTGLGLEAIDGPGGAPVVGVDAGGWVGALLDDALHASVAPVPTPAGFTGRLRPYQERGVGWLAFLGRLGLGACLADDMGLGKTAQLIASVLADPALGPTLVVCPTSVLGNWDRELARFAPSLRVLLHHGPDRFRGHDEPFAARVGTHDVVLTSYALVARDADELEALRWGRLVLDEAQQVKNPYTAQAKAVHRLGADRRIALIGTPVENRLTELWAIMQSVNPGLLGSVRSFKERFAGPIERDSDPEATARLQRIVSPFVLRRLKTDKSIIDDLPDKIEQTERCPLTREQATLYQAVVDDLLEQAEGADGIDRRGIVLAGIMKLKQVCNHPAHFLKDGTALAGRSGKLQRAEELLDELLAAGDKALCFTQFAEWGATLAPYLARRFGIEVPWLHGGLTRRKRDDLVARFQESDGPPVFVVSLKAGGTGLNLTAATHVLHFDRWWNPAVEDQATDRTYRIGQHRNVIVNKLVSTGTVEERIDEMITAKRALAEKVVGSGEGWITELSTDELRDVLALRADAMED
jgi:SNF2 family DNA or RNA helicase